jgi:hypothetical protein
MFLHMMYFYVHFVAKITVKDFDARMISSGLDNRYPGIPIRPDKIRAASRLFFLVILIKCRVRWDGTSQILKLWFYFGHPCSTCSHTCSSTAADPHQHNSDLLSFPDLHGHLSVLLARLGLHDIWRLVYLCMMVRRSGDCSSAFLGIVVPFCWSESVVPCHKSCKQNMEKHPSSRDSHFENLSSSSEIFQQSRCQLKILARMKIEKNNGPSFDESTGLFLQRSIWDIIYLGCFVTVWNITFCRNGRT